MERIFENSHRCLLKLMVRKLATMQISRGSKSTSKGRRSWVVFRIIEDKVNTKPGYQNETRFEKTVEAPGKDQLKKFSQEESRHQGHRKLEKNKKDNPEVESEIRKKRIGNGGVRGKEDDHGNVHYHRHTKDGLGEWSLRAQFVHDRNGGGGRAGDQDGARKEGDGDPAGRGHILQEWNGVRKEKNPARKKTLQQKSGFREKFPCCFKFQKLEFSTRKEKPCRLLLHANP